MARVWVSEALVELPSRPEFVTFRLFYLGKK